MTTSAEILHIYRSKSATSHASSSFDMNLDGLHILDLGIFHHVARIQDITIPHQGDLLVVRHLHLRSEVLSNTLDNRVL